MRSRKGFTLIELMVVILIVGILAAVAIPIMRGRIDAAKWSEGRAMMGSIATGIRAYVVETDAGISLLDPLSGLPTPGATPTQAQLGFAGGDLTGTYFVDGDFSWVINGMDPLDFLITATPVGKGITLVPATLTLDEEGQWL